MAVMCEECKCSTTLDKGCANGCGCCNGINDLLEVRTAQVLALTEEEKEDADEDNPILFAEQGPNRFALMSLFFQDKAGGDNDGVRIEEDLDLNTVTVHYFTEEGEVELTEGAVYEWAIKFYQENY